jgi:hypothetical protein
MLVAAVLHRLDDVLHLDADVFATLQTTPTFLKPAR